jgi:hypothetical protein
VNARWCFRVSRPRTKVTPALSTASFALSLLLLAAPAASRADNLFVAYGGSGTIEEFNSSGLGTVFASGLNGLTGLAFDRSGNLYAAVGDTVEKFDSSGVGTVFASTGLNLPWGLAFDGAGNLYVSNPGNNTIEKFNSSGAGTVFASGLNLPSSLAFDSSGNLFAAVGDTVEEFTSLGVGTVFASGLNGATGLAFDRDGNLYVSNVGDSTIRKFSPAGADLGLFADANSYLYRPFLLAFDRAGNLYAADSKGTVNSPFPMAAIIAEIDSSGANAGIFYSSPVPPTGMAFETIPEPSTWALLAVGLIALFSVKRRCP